jgi:hypothetical protein
MASGSVIKVVLDDLGWQATITRLNHISVPMEVTERSHLVAGLSSLHFQAFDPE